MSVTIIKQPTRTINYGGVNFLTYFTSVYNRNDVKWRSTLLTEAVTIVGKETPTYGEYVNGNYIVLSIDSGQYRFTWKTTPDDSGFEFALRGAMSNTDYATYLLDTIISTGIFADRYTVETYVASGFVWFRFTSVGYRYLKLDSLDDASMYQYSINLGALPVSASIKINDVDVFDNLIPKSGTASFNLEEVIKSYFETFDDVKKYTLADVNIFDSELCKKISIKLSYTTVGFYGNTTETTTIYAYFVRSVRQHHDKYGTSMYYYESDNLFANQTDGTPFCRLLIPGGVKKIRFAQRLKIYKGYPQDVSVIAKPENTINQFIVYQEDETFISSTNYTIPASTRTDKYVQRIILSDGVDMLTALTDITTPTKGKLQIGNKVDADTSPTSVYTCQYEIIDDCGVYVKWFNSAGGWSYWLFKDTKRSTYEMKSKGTISSDVDNLSYQSDEKNIGVDATEKIFIAERDLDLIDYNTLLDLITSPAVYLYLKPKGDSDFSDSLDDCWLKLPQITGFKQTKKAKSVTYSLGIEFMAPKIYTQTL